MKLGVIYVAAGKARKQSATVSLHWHRGTQVIMTWSQFFEFPYLPFSSNLDETQLTDLEEFPENFVQMIDI
jgi:hypothetical protein